MKITNIYSVLFAVIFVLIITVTVVYTRAADPVIVTTSASITNTSPIVDEVRISDAEYGANTFTGGIPLNVGADKAIHVTGVVSDANGDADIATVGVVFYRTSKGSACTSDKNDCYVLASCTLDAAYGTDTEARFDCPLSLAYWTDATADAGRYAGTDWTALVTVTDLTPIASSLTKTVEVNSLLALNIPATIAYGSRVLGEQSTATNSVATLLTQRGNTKADVELQGTSMACSGVGTIPVSAQRWSLVNEDYASSTNTLTTGQVTAGRNIGYRNSDTTELATSLFWNIAIPATGVQGNCEGTNTISLIARFAQSEWGAPWRVEDFGHEGTLTESGWVNTGSTLPSTLNHSQTAIIGEYIYLFGGSNAGWLNTIYRAPLSNPLAWVDTGSTLPAALDLSQVAVIGDYVYLFGGQVSGAATNVIYRAPISNPLAWVDTGSTLPSILARSQTAIIGDYIYLFGGYDNVSASTVIYRAPLSNPLAWVDTGSTLPASSLTSHTAVIGDYIYLFGGGLGTGITEAIYRAPLSNPLSWTNTGSTLPTKLSLSQTAIIGDYVYLFGGRTTRFATGASTVIYRAPLSNPLSWTNTGSTLPGNLDGSQAAIIGNYVYLFGGQDGAGIVNAIYRAPIVP